MSLRAHWTLDPSVTCLNHGSFGACPIPVLDAQAALRAELEREPVQFFLHRLEPLLDAARGALGVFVGADPDDLAFLPNATAGVSTVVRSLELSAGDELLTTDHAYNACKNQLDGVAARAGARVVVAKVPFPIASPDDVAGPLLAAAGARTKLLLLDHVTSPTALVFPVERIVAAFAERGIDTLVDGAHAPGMLALDLAKLGAAYYTGNCHKWLCAPKGAAFLHVRRDRQDRVRPLSISHGANSPRTDRSRFRLEFDWSGTDDPTAFLCVPDAIRFLGGLFPGGWTELRASIHQAAVDAQRVLAEALRIPLPAPASMLGSMTSLPMPRAERPAPGKLDALQASLFANGRIEVPVFPSPIGRVIRAAMPVYATSADVAKLAAALAEVAGSAH